MMKNKRIFLSALFAISTLLLLEDMISDLNRGSSFSHLFEEILVFIMLTMGVVYIWKDNFNLRANLTRTQVQLEAAQKQSNEWHQKNQTLIKGLGAAIDAQLDQWTLTTSEKEIALLLIKGLSMKEIAEIRNTAERTVRQQSLAIYQKSGLSGRAELSAFFLEDLLG